MSNDGETAPHPGRSTGLRSDRRSEEEDRVPTAAEERIYQSLVRRQRERELQRHVPGPEEPASAEEPPPAPLLRPAGGDRLTAVALALAVIFCLSSFWPGPYRFHEVGNGSQSFLVRENRFTGRTELFSPASGWRDRDNGATPEAPLFLFLAGCALVGAFLVGLHLGERSSERE